MLPACHPDRPLDAGAAIRIPLAQLSLAIGWGAGCRNQVPQRQKATGSEMCDGQKDKRKAKEPVG
jgi:hypothetical protein